MDNAQLDTFVNQVKSIAEKYGFDCDFTQDGEWYQFRFAGERQLFFLNMEDTRNYFPTHHSSYEVLGFDIEDFVREVNRQVQLAELSLDYNSWEDIVKRHQGRKDIDECARDNGIFIRNISKELRALAKQYGATNVKDSRQLKNKDMKQIKDGYDTLGGFDPKFGRGDIVITDHDYTPREIVDMRVQNHRYEYMLEGTSGWWSEWQLVLVEPNSYIHDSEKVEDMIKPVHLRGYAERVRAKRQKAEEESNTEEEKQDVTDSKKYQLETSQKLTSDDMEEMDGVLEKWSEKRYGKNIFKHHDSSVADSKQIKDAEDIVPLDGLLMIAFKEGQEEEGFNAVKQHANESNELDGVKYETYDVNEQDGVTIVDMCAVTNDANAFVKVLLKEWGVIDAVAELDFKKSEEMQEAQENVSDSKKINDQKACRVYLGTVSEGHYFNLQGEDWVVVKHNVQDDTVVCESAVGNKRKVFQGITIVNMCINDSQKVGDDVPRRFTPITPKINMYEPGVRNEHPSDIARRDYEMRQYLKE